MLVSNVAEPVYFALILEQAQRDAMNGCITPALVEETARAIEVVEVVAKCLAAPEGQVTNFEIGPEMARRVAVGFLVVLRPPLPIF